MLPTNKELQKSWASQIVGWILRGGEMPNHVAFIMDGNRRFARRKNEKVIKGHESGFHKLAQVLSWCEMLNIPEVTVYAFSAENFKRSQEEVNNLMDLARQKFLELLKEINKLNEKGIRIRMIGEISLLPMSVRQPAAELELKTKNNSNYILNICLAYTSRLELLDATKRLLEEVSEKKKGLNLDDLDEEIVNQSLYLSSTPQLLIRTSGEVRLSDFLLMQCSNAKLSFCDDLWPEFSIWTFYRCIIEYQCDPPKYQKPKNLSRKQKEFLRKLEQRRKGQILQWAKSE